MQKQQRPQTRVEGNIIYLIRKPEDGTGSTQAIKSGVSKTDNRNAAADSIPLKEQDDKLILAAMRAKSEGKNVQQLCAEAMARYSKALKDMCDPENNKPNKADPIMRSTILKRIAKIYEIWGNKAQSDHYLHLSDMVIGKPKGKL